MYPHPPAHVEGSTKIINLTRPSEEFPFLYFIRSTCHCVLSRFTFEKLSSRCTSKGMLFAHQRRIFFFRVMYTFVMHVFSWWRGENNIQGRERNKLMTRGDVNPVSHVGGMLAYPCLRWATEIRRCTRAFVHQYEITCYERVCDHRAYVYVSPYVGSWTECSRLWARKKIAIIFSELDDRGCIVSYGCTMQNP